MAERELKALVEAATKRVLGHAPIGSAQQPTPSMVRPLVAANWKMNPCRGTLAQYAVEIGQGPVDQVETVLMPPAVLLSDLAAALRAADSGGVHLGVQDVHWEPKGAHTGELSAALVQAAGAGWTLVGHSERRQSGERDDDVQRKLVAALAGGLSVILCVGELLTERQSGATSRVLRRQVTNALRPTHSSPPGPQRLAVAYEPVWAIGTGQTASTAQIEESVACIHELVEGIYGEAAGCGIRVLYGGSVSGESAPAIMAVPGVDGLLVGGASLDGRGFRQIVAAADSA